MQVTTSTEVEVAMMKSGREDDNKRLAQGVVAALSSFFCSPENYPFRLEAIYPDPIRFTNTLTPSRGPNSELWHTGRRLFILHTQIGAALRLTG